VTVRDILGVHTLSCCLPVLPVFFFFFVAANNIHAAASARRRNAFVMPAWAMTIADGKAY
jgi:hypothetical protein